VVVVGGTSELCITVLTGRILFVGRTILLQNVCRIVLTFSSLFCIVARLQIIHLGFAIYDNMTN
jgi:hypothetical protein